MMKIKRFEAQTVQEAIKQVKETLGPDAVILSIKEIKKGKGILGFLQKAVEVTAAIDVPEEKFEGSHDEVFEQAEVPSDVIQAINELNLEIKELKRYIQTFVSEPSDISKDIFQFCRYMKANGLAADIALKLIEGFKEGMITDAINEKMNIKEFLIYLLSNLIRVLPPLEETEDSQVAVFVGPTGTGKTTTLAKIVGNMVKIGKRVGVITLDPRSFAWEHLNSYINPWHVPLEIVNSPKKLLKVIQRFKDKDTILVDTCGCSPYNEFQLKDLERYFRYLNKSLVIYLVLDVNTKDEVLLQTVRQFDCLAISSLIFTKLDEGETHGSILNQMIYTGKPLSYFTVGQRVPEDIEIATPERVIELVINNLRGDNDVERNVQIS